ncbi:hypothetical protein FBQ95_08255 [Chloroflexi bacterium CFX3]|nr:hypothetical protein [Chloroflexi bacterium CFX3]
MIFAHTLNLVLSERKSQTRRLVKAGETITPDQQCIYITGKRNIYQVNKTYAVQPGRGKKAVARIRITGLRRERLEKISRKDARAEGFASRKAFFEAWRSIHGAQADLTVEVWVISFCLESVVANEFKELYERQHSQREPSTHQSIDHSYDVSASVERVSGTDLHRRNKRVR